MERPERPSRHKSNPVSKPKLIIRPNYSSDSDDTGKPLINLFLETKTLKYGCVQKYEQYADFLVNYTAVNTQLTIFINNHTFTRLLRSVGSVGFILFLN